MRRLEVLCGAWKLSQVGCFTVDASKTQTSTLILPCAEDNLRLARRPSSVSLSLSGARSSSAMTRSGATTKTPSILLCGRSMLSVLH